MEIMYLYNGRLKNRKYSAKMDGDGRRVDVRGDGLKKRKSLFNKED